MKFGRQGSPQARLMDKYSPFAPSESRVCATTPCPNKIIMVVPMNSAASSLRCEICKREKGERMRRNECGKLPPLEPLDAGETHAYSPCCAFEQI